MDLNRGLISKFYFGLNTPKKIIVSSHKILLKKASIVLPNPAFLFTGNPFGKKQMRSNAFRVWGLWSENISTLMGGMAGMISLLWDQYCFYQWKETNIGTIVLAHLMKTKVKIKGRGNLWVGKLWVQKERSPKSEGNHVLHPWMIFGFGPPPSKYGGLKNGQRKNGNFAVECGRGVSLTIAAGKSEDPCWCGPRPWMVRLVWPFLLLQWIGTTVSKDRFSLPPDFWCDAKKASMPAEENEIRKKCEEADALRNF